MTRTVTDLGVAEDVRPYLYAIFVHDDELPAMRALLPAVDWTEIGRRSDRIFGEMQHTSQYPEDHGFYESGKGVKGI